MSEFINRYARWEYGQDPNSSSYGNFKKYRNSSLFTQIASDIRNQAKKIVSYAERCSSRFDSLDIDVLLNAYGAGDSDFNDLVIADICRSNSYTFVTHDSYFKTITDIEIITANKRLLKL